MLALLQAQAALYKKLESLAARQRSLVTSEDVGPLLSLLADRQKLSEELARIGHRLAPIRREWSWHRQRFTAPQRDEAERMVGEIGDCLQRIMESDEQDARVLLGRKETVAKTLRTTHTTGQAILAYRAPVDGTVRLDCVNDGA